MSQRKNKLIKAHIANSLIPNSGKGLFASNLIKAHSIIAEFHGIIRAPTDAVTSNRSLIRFSDDYYLECGPDDLASFTNDPIAFPVDRRKLYETLESNSSFYQMHQMSRNNSYIKLNEKFHRAFLVATEDIPKDQEIYCHYGFSYWFMKECLKGFLYEEKMDTIGFPKELYNFPAFQLYIMTFYPSFSEYKIVEHETGESDVIISYSNTLEKTVLHLDNYVSIMRKAPLPALKN